MHADPESQLLLLDVAAVDTEVAQLNHRKRTLPEHEQLAGLNEQRRAASELVVASQTRLADANLELRRVESDLEPARERLERNRQRSSDGSVNDPRALRGLLDEIEHLSGRINKLEDEQLEIMQVLEDENSEQDTLMAAKTRIEDRMRALMAKRDDAGREIDAQLSDLARDRADLVARIPADLMTLYGKVAQRQGTGAAELQAGRCTGCTLAVDASSLGSFAAAAPDAVLRCDECGRILVRTKRSGL